MMWEMEALGMQFVDLFYDQPVHTDNEFFTGIDNYTLSWKYIFSILAKMRFGILVRVEKDKYRSRTNKYDIPSTNKYDIPSTSYVMTFTRIKNSYHGCHVTVFVDIIDGVRTITDWEINMHTVLPPHKYLSVDESSETSDIPSLIRRLKQFEKYSITPVGLREDVDTGILAKAIAYVGKLEPTYYGKSQYDKYSKYRKYKISKNRQILRWAKENASTPLYFMIKSCIDSGLLVCEMVGDDKYRNDQIRRRNYYITFRYPEAGNGYRDKMMTTGSISSIEVRVILDFSYGKWYYSSNLGYDNFSESGKMSDDMAGLMRCLTRFRNNRRKANIEYYTNHPEEMR